MARYIFITGGVVSSLGKGIAAASLGAILQAKGYKVRIRKLDGYLNVDPGTMNPYEHGEVFVTNDGGEADLDLGHYERFTGQEHTKNDITTMGKIYARVIAKERHGDYLGGTVQIVPHVTDEIKSFLSADTDGLDFVICEIGGTVGDIESQSYLEAVRQMAIDRGRENCLFIHLTLLPYLGASGEVKTKATQHSVRTLLVHGIQPDILLCRTDQALTEKIKEKIGLFCNVSPKRVITARDVKSIYEVPLELQKEGLDSEVCRYFHLPETFADLRDWHRLVEAISYPKHRVRIAIVGKYTKMKDSYKSIHEALTIAGAFCQETAVEALYIDAEDCEHSTDLGEMFKDIEAILVPGGFGNRGVEGKLRAIRYARENKIPFLGICLGMQLAVIDAARHLAQLEGASSTEFHPQAPHPVVGLIHELMPQSGDLGGTMRLGSYKCFLQQETLAHELYGADVVEERHRHRYEVNMAYRDALENAGLFFSGISEDGMLPEMVERHDHPFFIACQFHPEFKARSFFPHPLFRGLVASALKLHTHNQDQGSERKE